MTSVRCDHHASVLERRSDLEAGTVSVTLPLLLWVATVVSVALIDLGGYLVAASRAQTIADSAALAAVSVEASHQAGHPRGAAAEVVSASGAELVACACSAGTGHAEVTVRIDVPGLVVPRLAAGSIEATAAAQLTSAGRSP